MLASHLSRLIHQLWTRELQKLPHRKQRIFDLSFDFLKFYIHSIRREVDVCAKSESRFLDQLANRIATHSEKGRISSLISGFRIMAHLDTPFKIMKSGTVGSLFEECQIRKFCFPIFSDGLLQLNQTRFFEPHSF